MSNEIQNAQIKFKQLLAQKSEQELSLMKLKCEIRELKCKLEKLKTDKAREDAIYNNKQEDVKDINAETPLKNKSKRYKH